MKTGIYVREQNIAAYWKEAILAICAKVTIHKEGMKLLVMKWRIFPGYPWKQKILLKELIRTVFKRNSSPLKNCDLTEIYDNHSTICKNMLSNLKYWLIFLQVNFYVHLPM